MKYQLHTDSPNILVQILEEKYESIKNYLNCAVFVKLD